MKFSNVQRVAECRLCVGCGVCAYICPEKKIRLVNVVMSGIRPHVDVGSCSSCDQCIKVCPGLGVSHTKENSRAGYIAALIPGWGPILEVWEGYACDPDIRYRGSSGGAATAIALYCLEKEGMSGIVHVAENRRKPLENISVYSKNKSDLLEAAGSRYSPASPCTELGMIEHAPGLSVFLGKPCDVQGLRLAQEMRPMLNVKLGLAISIFCAGTPSSLGTRELLNSAGVNFEDVESMKYRGEGWPGKFEVKMKEKKGAARRMSYEDSWDFIQKYRPYRCHLCPDGTGEFADISCGDPWYREIKDDEQGHSIILVRTEKGRRILRKATSEGYIRAVKADPAILEKSQPNLFRKRSAVWGRLIAFRLLGLPAPQYGGFPLFANWLALPLSEMARSVFGTMRRIVQRKYRIPDKLV